jgi:GT2 family glycosyltransferase
MGLTDLPSSSFGKFALSMSSTDKIATLTTCFNRKAKTMVCLQRLFQMPGAERLEVYLLDDGSTDGTGDAVRAEFPQVRVFQGDGSHFWSGGMRLLFEEAKKGDYSGYLWLNDDIELDNDALTRIFDWADRSAGSGILGGSMRFPGRPDVSYGGSLKLTPHPMRFTLQKPDSDNLVEVHVMNGNFYYIPKKIVDSVGGINPGLLQQGADYEYATRARQAGFKVYLLPGTYGVCDTNDFGPRLRGFAGLRKISKPRHLPYGPTKAYYKTMAGSAWPLWLHVLYVRTFFVGY